MLAPEHHPLPQHLYAYNFSLHIRLAILLICLVSIPIQFTRADERSSGATAPQPRVHQAGRIALILDDIGNNHRRAQRALALPGPLTLAVLPHTPAAKLVTHVADQLGKEVILHQPMENVYGSPIGPGGLRSNQPYTEFIAQLRSALKAVPNSRGVSNHMGSHLTQQGQAMQWLMKELQHQGLYFFDSRTTPHTVAQHTAIAHGVPALGRDIFLDHDPSVAAINRALDQAIELAQHRGWVVVIGHPYDSTLSVLEDRLPRLQQQGVEQVLLSYLVARHGKSQRASLAARELSGLQNTLR